MNKFQKLAQLNRDIELLENAGKIKAAEVLHQKFIKEAQYMPQMMPMMMMPQMMPMMPQMMARPTMPVARPAVTPVTTPAPVTQPAPVATPAPKPSPVPVGETAKPTPVAPPPPPPPPANTKVNPPYEGSVTNPGGQNTPPGKPTEGGNYLMNPGDNGKTVFTDPGTGFQTDPPGSDQVFDHYYGKIQEAYGLPEPQKSQMLKNLFNQIKQRGDKLGGRLQGSLLNQYFDGSGNPLY
jgi:hypothetical protein